MDLFTIVCLRLPLLERYFSFATTWILTNVKGFLNEPETCHRFEALFGGIHY
jgi:hypothetical protein